MKRIPIKKVLFNLGLIFANLLSHWISLFIQLQENFISYFKKEEEADHKMQEVIDSTDRMFVFYLSIFHIVVYLLFIVPGFLEIPYAKELLLIVTFVSILMVSLVYKLPRLYQWIYIYSTVTHGIVFYLAYQLILMTATSETFHYFNQYFLCFAVVILFHSIRMEKLSCVITGFFIILCHCLVIFDAIHRFDYTITSFHLFIPTIVFAFTAFVGSVMIHENRTNYLKLSMLTQERTLMQSELQLAKKVQESLFPKEIKIPGFNYEVFRRSHNFIGGDFFDFVQLREGNVGVFLVDVAGHGISSAMVAAILKVFVATIPYRFKLSPERLLDHLDSRLSEDLNSYHASAIYIYLDFITKRMILANAGHPYLLYAKKNEPFHEIITEGSIMGFHIRKPIAVDVHKTFEPGDRLFMFTDGLSEVRDKTGEPLDDIGIMELLNRHHKSSTISELKKKLLYDLENDKGITDFVDDTMFLLFEME